MECKLMQDIYKLKCSDCEIEKEAREMWRHKETISVFCDDCYNKRMNAVNNKIKEYIHNVKKECVKTWNPFKELILIFKHAKKLELSNFEKERSFYFEFYKGDSCVNMKIT